MPDCWKDFYWKRGEGLESAAAERGQEIGGGNSQREQAIGYPR